METSASEQDPDFFLQHISNATRCKVNFKMKFCRKLNTEVNDQNVTYILVVTCKRALIDFAYDQGKVTYNDIYFQQ